MVLFLHMEVDFMDKIEVARLIDTAINARKKSYSPYSHFMVGAALLATDGNIYSGCNIENAAYSPTICAERSAFASAVSDGVRDFSAIAIVAALDTSTELDYVSPCGVCRQFMAEFCSPNFPVIMAKSTTDYKIITLAELLPHSFCSTDILG